MLCMPEVWFDPEMHIPLNTGWSIESGIAPELSGSGLQIKKQKGKKKGYQLSLMLTKRLYCQEQFFLVTINKNMAAG